MGSGLSARSPGSLERQGRHATRNPQDGEGCGTNRSSRTHEVHIPRNPLARNRLAISAGSMAGYWTGASSTKFRKTPARPYSGSLAPSRSESATMVSMGLTLGESGRTEASHT